MMKAVTKQQDIFQKHLITITIMAGKKKYAPTLIEVGGINFKIIYKELEDFGQRRSKSKLRDIEGSLKRLGRVCYNMSKKHYLLLLLITFLFGSAYPVQKLIFNENVPPLLMGSLRMLIVFICLIPSSVVNTGNFGILMF